MSHKGAVIAEFGQTLAIQTRKTPAPGPNELLIQVKAVAMNSIDYYHRDFGFQIKEAPAVAGYDVSGIVVAAGSSLPSTAPKVGSRVTALTDIYYNGMKPDYGGFQEYLLVPASNVTEIPEAVRFIDASLLPMAVVTTVNGWYSIGLPLDYKVASGKKEGMLVWGAAGSVGSAAVQSAKEMGFVIYATASPRNFEAVKDLGADKVFDYKDENVVTSIVNAAKTDHIPINFAYNAASSTNKPITEILAQAKSAGVVAMNSSAVVLNAEDPTIEGVESKFVLAPEPDEARSKHFSYVFNDYLKPKLEKGSWKFVPKAEVIPGGIEAIDGALNKLKGGVSASKLVVEL